MSSANLSTINQGLLDQVRKTWFADIPEGAPVASMESAKRWFGQLDKAEQIAFDDVCRDQFGTALDSLAPEKFSLPPVPSTWQEERAQAEEIIQPFITGSTGEAFKSGSSNYAKNWLALVILLDQIPRNIYRNSQGLIFNHYDRIARAVSHTVIDQVDRADQDPAIKLSSAYVPWFYMPFMHSEWLGDHDLAIKLFGEAKTAMEAAGNEEGAGAIAYNIVFEEKHRVIIAKFGRYPHRNTSLGREFTQEEKEYLENGGDTFGSTASS